VTLDMIGGLMLIALALGLLTTVYVRQKSLSTRLGADREAVRRAELALLQLQGGVPLASLDPTVRLRALDRPSPARFVWCEAVAVVNARSATLVGLVPEESLP
jgi:hypothetical protein